LSFSKSCCCSNSVSSFEWLAARQTFRPDSRR
jgi:hypothetical protein